jgi:hypothetical protein
VKRRIWILKSAKYHYLARFIVRKAFLFTAPILGMLLLASPAFAISYSSIAILYLDTLTFSGISVSPGGFYSGQHQSQSATLVNHSTGTFESSGSFASSWVTNTHILSDPNAGGAVSILDPNFLISSISLTGLADVFQRTERSIGLIANDTGYLTVSMQYALSQGGVLDPTALTLLNAAATVDMGLFPFTNPFVASGDAIYTNNSILGEGSKTGTLSFTQYVVDGRDLVFHMSTINSVTYGVPEPDTLLLFGLGLVGLVAWRWKRAA